MTAGRGSCRRAEAGLTLIEMLVTIALMTVAIVGIATAFAAAERTAGIGVTEAQAEVLMRQATDALRSNQVAYSCGNVSAAQAAYSAYVTAHVSSSASVPAGGVSLLSGTSGPALWDCTKGTAVVAPCPTGDTCEAGVQRITVSVAFTNGSVNGSLIRTVYKSHT